MRSTAGPDDALGELRHLLFGAETRRVDGLESELRRLALVKLDRAELLAETAEILDGALRRAEVARHRELAEALAPLVVGAIRAEIRNSKDSLVDALYPLMGRLVAAAVANAIRNLSEDLARRIDGLVSAQVWRWRLKSWATGRPIGAIALAESQRARLVRVLCLERGSGQLLAVWPQVETDGRSDLVSGMIAAITEFASTTFARESGELRALDLGSQHVLLRSSGALIVAAECEGVLDQEDEARIDAAFLRLIGLYERAGRLEPAQLAAMAAALKRDEAARRPGRGGVWVVRIAAVAAAAGLIWWAGGAWLNWRREATVEAALARARAAEPDAASYPLTLTFDHARGRVTLSGLAPDPTLAARIAPALAGAAAPYAVETRVAVVDSAAGAQARADRLEARLAESESQRRDEREAAQRQTAALAADLAAARREADAAAQESRAGLAAAREAAQREAAAFAADLAAARREANAAAQAAETLASAALGTARRDFAALSDGLADARREAEALAAALAAQSRAGEAEIERLRAGLAARLDEAGRLAGQVDGLRRDLAGLAAESRTPLARLRAAIAGSAIFFSRDAELVDPAAAQATIARIAGLVREAGVGIRVVGHTDETGSAQINQRRSRERADVVFRLLTEAGVPAQSIRIASRRAGNPISDVATVGSSPNRRVTFELLLDEEPVQ